jgi:EAL and modified HD-GYP domain-containing signal transduction protein
VEDGAAATAHVVLTAFSDVGLDELVGTTRAFVNVPYAFLTEGFCKALPTDRVVLEILEDVRIDRRVIDSARALVADGHTLALDDFVFRDSIEPLLELATIVKLDVLALGARELGRQVELLRPFDVELLAEKVEATDQITPLRELGFEYFQGFALQRPAPVRGSAIEVSKPVLLRILAATNRPDITPAELVDTIACDPSIVYALLRIVNSACFSLKNEVSSLHQALVLLGIAGIRNWTLMMVMSRLASDSREALIGALVRAKMCDLCAVSNSASASVGFTAGLICALPSMLDRPLEDIIDELALAPDLRDALLAHEGPIGQVLEWVLAYEARDQDRLAAFGAPLMIANSYIEAVKWSTHMTAELLNADATAANA